MSAMRAIFMAKQWEIMWESYIASNEVCSTPIPLFVIIVIICYAISSTFL